MRMFVIASYGMRSTEHGLQADVVNRIREFTRGAVRHRYGMLKGGTEGIPVLNSGRKSVRAGKNASDTSITKLL